MLFPEEDTPLLKKWIMQRLADTSDADADVLADYVLALLRSDADVETVRQLCLSEIPDFLKEDSNIFVQDVFNVIQSRAYLSGGARNRSNLSVPPSGPSLGNSRMSGQLGALNGPRKRSYNDRGDTEVQDNGFHGGDVGARQYKQLRRGGPVGGRAHHDNTRNGRGGYGNILFQGAPGGPNSVPTMPNLPPFDPNNPMAAILAMQAMGFPLPGMPQPPMDPQNFGARNSSGQNNARRKGRCRDYDEKGFCARGSNCHYEHSDEYNPNTSLLETTQGNNAPNPRTTSRGGLRGRGQGGIGRQDFANNRRNGRSEFSSDRQNHDRSNTTIVIENIPEDKFAEEEVRTFFNEFGDIVEISMRPYKRLAIVKFAEWDSANAAYKSPKVIFDNRFVKVYWFLSPESLPQPPSGNANGAGSALASNQTKVSEPPIDIGEFTRKQEDVQKAYEEKQRKKQEVESARQELEKRQEELLKNQAEEKRRLLEKIAAKSGSKLADVELQNSSAALGPPATSQTDALRAQLAALEAEAQLLGIDTTALPDQSLGAGVRGGYRGRGGGFRGRGTVPRGFRGGYRGRGAPFGSPAGGSVMRLDNRPKTISLSGVDFTLSEKEEALRQYLLGVGDYTSLDIKPTTTTVTFKERYVAETFMYKTPGCNIPGVGRVEMAWIKSAPSVPQSTATTNTSSTTTTAIDNKDADVTMDDEGMSNNQAGNLFGVENGSEGDGGDRNREARQQNLDYDVAEDEWI